MATRTDHGVCMLCEAVCGLEVEHDGRRVLRVRGDDLDPFSRGHICPKGVALADLQNDPDRLRRPLLRRGGDWEEVGWEEAIETAARGLAAVQQRHGRDAVGLYLGNPSAHSYAALLYYPLLVDALGSRNLFSATSVDVLPRFLVSYELYGNRMHMPVPDLERTRYLLMLGANPAVSNGSGMTAPDVVKRLRDLRERGGRLVVVDPRRTETAELADEHHFIRPGADALFLAALLHALFDEKLADPGPLAQRLEGFDELPRLLAPFAASRVAPAVGIEADTIRRLARDFAAARGAACYGRVGTCVQEFGTLATWFLDLVNVATGNLDRPGGSMFTTPAADLAAAARVLGQAGSFDRWRSRVSGLPESSGEFPVKALAEEIETPGAGQIRAMVTHAGNPVLSLPNGRRLDRLFEGLEFMVSIDIYLNETTRHADVILPPTFGLERDHYALLGHAVAVRNTAHYAPALLDKPDGSRHDWEILAALAERIGRVRGGVEALKGRVRGALGRAIGPRRVLGWILRLGPHRLRLARLERERHGVDLGALEPRLAEILGSRRLHVVPERFRADLPRLERWLEAHSRADGDGLVLISRRGLRSNNSWMHNSERLVAGRERCVLLMHPADASRRGLAHGQRVAIESRVGAVVAALEVSDEVMPGVVSLPHGWGHGRPGTRMRVAAAHPGVSVNDVVDDARVDGLSGTASLSGVPVAVSAAPA